MLDAYAARIDAIREAKEANAASKTLGLELAKAKRELRTVEHAVQLRMRADGMTATAISNALKSEPEVAEVQFKVDCAEVLYKAECESVNISKLDARLLEADIAREWSQEGRTL